MAGAPLKYGYILSSLDDDECYSPSSIVDLAITNGLLKLEGRPLEHLSPGEKKLATQRLRIAIGIGRASQRPARAPRRIRT